LFVSVVVGIIEFPVESLEEHMLPLLEGAIPEVFEVLALQCRCSSNKKIFDGLKIGKLNEFMKGDMSRWQWGCWWGYWWGWQ
jgi:hypothetical protein